MYSNHPVRLSVCTQFGLRNVATTVSLQVSWTSIRRMLPHSIDSVNPITCINTSNHILRFMSTVFFIITLLRFLLCQLLVHQYDNSIYVLGCMSMHRYITVLIRACVYIQTHESRRRPQLQMDFVIFQHTISGNER